MPQRAMIFAAGRGERMRPLTDSTPKPLLKVGGKRLIEWHLEKLASMGIREVVINTSYLAEQFPDALGDGSRWNLAIEFIDEGPIPLETGGGMLNALSLLGENPFLLINGDIWMDLDLAQLNPDSESLAHLVMVPNPAHVGGGDFALDADGRLSELGDRRLTYSGIGIYHAALFDNWRAIFSEHAGASESPPRFPLAPLLRAAMRNQQVTGQRFDGNWIDVGTPQRLAELDSTLRIR